MSRALFRRLGFPGVLAVVSLLTAVGMGAVMLLSIHGPLQEAAHATDSDSDGLSDAFENAYGTDPNDSDTDDDGWDDWNEVFYYGTNPLNDDTDGDAVGDATDTNPLDAGGDVNGYTTPTSTYARNLTEWAGTGASPQDGYGVYPHSGEFVYRTTPLQVKAGFGPDLPLTVTYFSGGAYDGLMGNNWLWAGLERVTLDGGGDAHLLFQWGPMAGVEVEFPTPGGSTPIEYDSPDDFPYLKLTKETDNTYTLEDSHGNQRTYGTDGKIAGAEDRFGNALTFHYTSGRVSSIDDASGHTVDIDYYATTNRVWKFTDDSGRTVTFRYNHFGQLAKITSPTSTEYPSGRTTEFRYTNGSTDPDLNDNLVRIIDPKGQSWFTAEYDGSDRVTEQHLNGDWTFSYAGSVTSITDPNGNDRDWTFSGNLPTLLEQYSNRDVRSGDPTSWDTAFGHNANGILNKVVYPRGNRVDMTYNSVGLMTERRRKETDTASTSGSDLVETWTYESTYYLPLTYTDPEGNETTYTLSTSKKVIENVAYETVTYLDPDQTVDVDYAWNSEGQLTSTTDGEGKETSYAYYTTGLRKGYLQTVTVDPGSSPHLALTTTYDYTDWGAWKSVTNPRGKTTTWSINEYNWVIDSETTSPQGYEVTYTYDANGNVTEKHVENVDKTNTRDTGNPWFTTTYSYNTQDWLTGKTEEVDGSTTRSWTYEYWPGGQMKLITKPEGNKVKVTYDERNLVYEQVRGFDTAVASTDKKDYDANGNLATWTDGRSKAWTHTYDLFDRRTKTVNPLGHYTEWVYDKNGNATEVKRYEEAGTTDVLMAHTKSTFDEMNRLYQVERGLKGVSSWTWLTTTTEYDKRSLPTSITDPRSKVTTLEYDAAGRRTAMEDALGNRVEYTLDANGNVTQVDEAEDTGHGSTTTFVTEMVYDEVDRLKERRVVDQTNSSSKHTTTWKYTSLNVLVEQVDPESNTQTWTHDALARVLTHVKTLASGSITRTWAFDDNDRMVSHKDDGNNETTWTYNARDLVTVETYPDSGTKEFDYDLTDNVIEWTDPNGTEVDLTYDDRGRNTARTITRGTGVLGTTSETYTFDALDRMTEAVDNDVTVQLTWDSLGRKTSEKSGPNPISSYGKTTSYTYDAASNLTSIDYPDGSFSVDRTYDDVNRLTLVEDGSAADIVATDYYGANGRLKKLTFGNTTTSTYGYDGFRWVSSISHEDSTPTEFAGFDMVRDDVGNILTEEWNHDSGKGNVYAYDKAYRLTKALLRSADPSAELASPGSQAYTSKLEYNLSDDSDRTSLVLTPYGQSAVTTNYTSNNVHEYTVAGGINRIYDDNGNLTDDGTNDFEYDYRNQLVRVTRQSDSTVIGEYEYDALGRRTRKTLEDSSEVRYYHDGVHEIEEFDENGVLLRKFVYRDDIDSISMMEASDQADVDGDTNTSELKRFYFHYDGRTNVSRLTDNDEQIVESYEADPYGAVSIKDQGGSPVSASAVGNPFTFQRRRLDEETGLYYFRARYYDSGVGQWLQRDPLGIEPGSNWRAFCESSPSNFVDPLGLDGGATAMGTAAVAAGETAAGAAAVAAAPYVLAVGIGWWLGDKIADWIYEQRMEEALRRARPVPMAPTREDPAPPDTGGGNATPEEEVPIDLPPRRPPTSEELPAPRILPPSSPRGTPTPRGPPAGPGRSPPRPPGEPAPKPPADPLPPDTGPGGTPTPPSSGPSVPPIPPIPPIPPDAFSDPERARRYLDMAQRQFRDALHRLKDSFGLGGKDNVLFDKLGNVWDAVSGDYLGNLGD